MKRSAIPASNLTPDVLLASCDIADILHGPERGCDAVFGIAMRIRVAAAGRFGIVDLSDVSHDLAPKVRTWLQNLNPHSLRTCQRPATAKKSATGFGLKMGFTPSFA